MKLQIFMEKNPKVGSNDTCFAVTRWILLSKKVKAIIHKFFKRV